MSLVRDEGFYGEAANEIANGTADRALMAKAYALALGEPEKTRALYIGFRADQLKEECRAAMLASQLRAAEAEKTQRAEEERIRKQRDLEEQKRRDIEAQRAAESWNRSSERYDHWDARSVSIPQLRGKLRDVPPPPEVSPVPRLSEPAVPLDEMIEKMKAAKAVMRWRK